jgi:hypothetical protein
VSELAFLSPDQALPEAVWRSPLSRALAGAPAAVRDLSLTGKIEVRGDIGADDGATIRITPQRALFICDYDECAELRAKLRERYPTVLDVTGGYAGLELRSEQAMRRLTDLDLGRLPAVGAVAHVQTVVLRDGDAFQLFFPQEYADYVAEVVLDTLEGLE